MKNRVPDQELSAELLRPILAKFRQRLSQSFHKYENFQEKISINELSTEVCEAIMVDAHKLAGSARTLGFSELGASAAEVEGYVKGILVLKDFENGSAALAPTFGRFLSNVSEVLDGYTDDTEVSSSNITPPLEAKFHVLIVDDDEFARDLVRTSLRNESCKISEAATGSEALTLLDSQRPDVIILDVNLPDMSGFAVMETIRGKSDGGEVPIVMLTREDSFENILLGRAGGVIDYLTKPISIQRLEQFFFNLLNQIQTKSSR